MKLALDEAWKYQGLTYPNPAVGCCVVGTNGEILAIGAHKKAGMAHAEVEALKIAYKILTQDTKIDSLESSQDIHAYLLANHNNIFHSVKLYTTLEPCSHVGKTPSCATLIASLGIKEVYVGSYDSNPLASGGNAKLMACGTNVVANVMQQECDALVEPFFKWNQNRFVFFKWAQRLNGTYDGGIISSLESRKHVHAMRDRCDLLVIGGNTVRIDRPTLDARLVNGKAPDVLILSRDKAFDKSIPLFNVEGRNVYIEANFERIKEYKHVMIEGGVKMFELSKSVVDRYVCYMAPTFGGKSVMQGLNTKFEILNLQKEAQDIIMWMKRIEMQEESKQEKIVSMFDNIAPTYDTANRVMSMGVDRSWRRKACDLAYKFYAKDSVDKIVDVACGTGDMMSYWKSRAEMAGVAVGEILGVDPSVGMLDVAREKFPKFNYHVSKATEIPLADASCDILSITYGIRNVVEREAALVEFNRVLKDNGLVVILEFMKNENPSLLGRIRDFYMNKILPKVGGFISKNLEAYEYLPNSIEDFSTVENMQNELRAAGFEILYTKSFSMDISTLIIAQKK